MNLSYWELKTWFSNIDFCVVGSGIVGLNCALNLRKNHPKARIIVLEKGVLPQGASTKNAGFACFGSLSEILADLESHSEDDVYQLVQKRVKGLQLLRRSLGDKNINYQPYGGYELFLNANKALYEHCLSEKDSINKFLYPIFKEDVFSEKRNIYKFNNIKENYVLNQFEGQLDTGLMMEALLKKVRMSNIKIFNSIEVQSFSENNTSLSVKTNVCDFSASKLFIATNGFASNLIDQKIKPARAQVLITKPIKNLKIKGTFHVDRGFYYFRNIDNRILLGGGRNLDFEGEETTLFHITDRIQNKLEALLKTTILPNVSIDIEHRWSGIMGVGKHKKPIVKQISNHVFCGVRLGGMGVAIGSLVGNELANLLD